MAQRIDIAQINFSGIFVLMLLGGLIAAAIIRPPSEYRVPRITDEERRITAIHESGHAVLAADLPAGGDILEITMVSRWGILGSVTRSERRAVREYGWQFGLAFQLVDDALDYASTGAELGKAPLTDLAEGKVTLPLLATLKRCTVGERSDIGARIKGFAQASQRGEKPDAESLERVAESVKRHLGIEVTIDRARRCAALARTQIEPFVEGDAKRALVALTNFVVSRRS